MRIFSRRKFEENKKKKMAKPTYLSTPQIPPLIADWTRSVSTPPVLLTQHKRWTLYRDSPLLSRAVAGKTVAMSEGKQAEPAATEQPAPGGFPSCHRNGLKIF